VPEISRFYGIVIEMRRNEHGRPHFHAKYGRDTITVMIEDDTIIGEFPTRKLALVRRWLTLHREELLQNWYLMRTEKLPRYIDPLD
jgi:hypothetical protein